MKSLHPTVRLVRPIRLGLRLATCFLLAAVSSVPVFAANSFVKGFQGIDISETVVDNSGTTYVLGTDVNKDCVIRKYDRSGALLEWPTGSKYHIVTNLAAKAATVAHAVLPDQTNALYIAGLRTDNTIRIIRFNAEDGSIEANLTGPATLIPTDVIFANNNVVLSANYTGSGDSTVFGLTAHARGQQAGLLLRLNASLSSTALNINSFGGNSGGNTAESLAIDEAGDIYVSGHFASGVFNLDGSVGSGLWKVDVVYSSGGIGDINTAVAVLGGATATRTNTAYFDKINFADGHGGNFTGDASVPGGGGDHYVIHAAGTIWIGTAGTYTFRSTTDDGTRVLIDGTEILSHNGTRSTGSTDGSRSLAVGLHTVDYIMFENGGEASAEFLIKPPGQPYVYWVQPTNLRDVQNKGYVAKFSNNFDSLKNAYFTVSETVGNDGAFHELAYAQGWVYAAGYWRGTANNPLLGLPDASLNNSKDIDIVRLDTDLTLKARATVKGNSDNEAYTLAPDDDGNLYVCGTYGTASCDFVGAGDRSLVDPTQDRKFTSLSSSRSSLFVAKLDGNLDYVWVKHPLDPLPDSFNTVTKLRWNPTLQRVFWDGSFIAPTGVLVLGEGGSAVTLNGSQAFLTVLDPGGTFSEEVNLTIISDYGKSRTQLFPFGGPLVGGNATETNRQAILRGVQVVASAPDAIFRSKGVDVANDTDADTRIRSTGYSVDNNVPTGGASSYTFTITKDTTVTFNWAVDYALVIAADLSETVGTVIQGLTSLASGNPVPAVQKHWIPANDPVISAIDAEAMDLNNPGLPVKYLVLGYHASGPPNTQNATTGQTNFFEFTGNEIRRQVPSFVMSTNAYIQYKWKLKIGVRVDTTGTDSADLPVVLVTRDPGSTNSTIIQSNGLGSGVFFFDEHTSLKVGTLEFGPPPDLNTKQLQGWLNGDGVIFANTGKRTNLASSFDLVRTNFPGLTNYLAREINDLVSPARVMWDYGDRIFEEEVFIGNSVTFNTVDDTNIYASLRRDIAPARLNLSEGPQGSTGDDMASWDDAGNKFYPLRPGILLSYWHTTSSRPDSTVIVRLTLKYPNAPHYRHVANTPPVVLDPVTNDLVSFNSLKYTETTTGANIDSTGAFTATGAGKSVLLFNETSLPAHGPAISTYRVRVVETKLWNANLPAIQTALIGEKITSSYDTAGLGTGFTMFTNARFNPFIYEPNKVKGPIIPVNLNPTATDTERLVVVWYEKRDKILWGYQAVRYEPAWPTVDTGLNRIVIASRYGNESVAEPGTNQLVVGVETIGTNVYPAETAFNPVRFQDVQIYNQPNRSFTGYNPNEEHAVLAPSLRSAAISPRPMAAYALRDGDLNVTNQNATYTSDPYVLVQFLDAIHQEPRMKVYSIVRAYTNLNAGELNYTYSFEQEMKAGEPVIPFYPLVQVIGATPCPGSYGKDGRPTIQRCFWKDHKSTGWAVSGDSFFLMYFYYPLSPDFWWPPLDGKQPGDCVAWLPDEPGYTNEFFDIDYKRNNQVPAAQEVVYSTTWPEDLPVLKVGETLTFPGGEYHLDHPTIPVTDSEGNVVIKATQGLPGAVGWAAGEVVYDTLNPIMDNQKIFDKTTVTIYQALEERTVPLALADLPEVLRPANKRTEVKNGKYAFVQASSSLQKRLFYDPILGKLGIKGFLNDKPISDPTLTASPPAVYVLEPNVLTASERDLLNGTAEGSPFADVVGSGFTAAVDALYNFCRNPNLLDRGDDGPPDEAYRLGLEQEIVRQLNGLPVLETNFGIVTPVRDASKGAPLVALGPGLAIVANPAFLRPSNTVEVSYVTFSENNSDALGGSPVVLHIIKVDRRERYRGSIKTILSDNVFDENIILRHTGDFGGNADELVFEWWYRPEDGTEATTPDRASPPNPWKLFADPSGARGLGFHQLTLKGNPSAPEALIGDSLFYLRYRHKDELNDGVNWEIPQTNQALGAEFHCVLNQCVPGIPYDWAGAGNSSPRDMDQDGQPDYKPQLAEGWIKRVLDRVNIYEARINDFSADNAATYSSIIRQLGARYEGAVALNPNKNVIENVGLIALYQTILNRGRGLSIDLSTPISTPSIANALELASTRLSDFYQLLGNEAYADALNPMIGFGSDSVEYGALAPSVFAFQNQMSSLLNEELSLLRGQDAYFGPPVYNRLFWNFTHAEGEAAYAMNYDISDVNNDGFVDENDGMILFPQGHGDAWGHFLTATKLQYELLRHPYFNWVSRSEFLNIQDIVVPVDYIDERKFAQAAAAKAKAGAEIVNMTYREKYVANPEGQWQGYNDTDKNRSWGVDDWAHRAAQGAYFDWVTANSLLPAVHPNTNYTGIQKVDRTTVLDIGQVAANLKAIQTTIEQVNNGNNPLGLANGALVFDLDPTFLEVGSTAQIGTRAVQGLLHFDQIFERALGALKNALAAFNNANEYNNMIRQIANSEQEFRDQVLDQDRAYRNQLIEIFGTPYEGTIGSGKAYPPGYQGPDTMLFMYVDENNLNDNNVPQPTAAYFDNYRHELTSSDATLLNGSGVISGIPNSWLTRYGLTFLDKNQITNSIWYTDFTDTNHAVLSDLPNLQVNLPIMASGYTFVKPPDWGRRASPGELQQIIVQMLQAQAEMNNDLANWDGKQLKMIQELKKLNATFDYNKLITDKMKGKIALDSTLGAIGLAFKVISAATEVAGITADEAAEVAEKAFPNETPTAGLAVSLGDAFSAVRSVFRLGGFSLKEAFAVIKNGFEKAADAVDLAKDIGDAIIELEIDEDERNIDLIKSLLDLQVASYDEANERVNVFKDIQRMTELSNQYRSKLAEGFRLIEERTVFNKRMAAQTQQRRYQDFTFRFARNAALEKYRSAFDLASRYAYLAGTTYDYDLNLAPDDPGSPINILTDIVKQRSLGVLNQDNQPSVGNGGLSEDLAMLMANYNNLKPRMGLNNPQIEHSTFSLRSEAFRILADTNSDPTWRATLRDASIYKPDLWQVPEFRHYCRPFTSVTNGPQPGLVIPFSTEIRSGKNFFGRDLGGGDSSYDPSVYATKIDAVACWFGNYDVENLPATPRIYLVPVGDDVMTIPNDPDLTPRLWKVLDQNVPIPYPSIASHLNEPTWKPLTDSIDSTFLETRRFASFRAFGFDHDPIDGDEEEGLTFNARLVGRSAWNTRWLLIIPGATLNADPDEGLNRFIESVTDIKLAIYSYGFPGN